MCLLDAAAAAVAAAGGAVNVHSPKCAGRCRLSPEVPDFAMVPRLLRRSSLVMPMPRSRMVSRRLAGST